MTVDRKAIDDMARIMAALNQQTAADTAALAMDDVYEGGDLYESAMPETVPAITRTPLSDPSIDAMKDILTRLQTVAESGPSAQVDPQLREALKTERTDRGARIGAWEIIKHNTEPTTYDVVSEDGRTVIARDLYLYEAALGLVRRLNEGCAINDRPIRELLVLEENYARARDDAASYKQRAQKMHTKGEAKRAAVAEDRFDRAQTKAMTVQEEILRLAGLIR